MFGKHFSRWLLILAIVIVAYYIYKAIGTFADIATAPFKFSERAIGAIGTGISNLFGDIEKFATGIIGGTTKSTSDNAPTNIQTGIPGNLGLTQPELQAASAGYVAPSTGYYGGANFNP